MHRLMSNARPSESWPLVDELPGERILEIANEIYEIGLRPHSATSLDPVIYDIAVYLMKELNADFVGIALFEPNEDFIANAWGWLRGGEPVPIGDYTSIRKDVFARVITTGEPILVRDRDDYGSQDLIPGMCFEVAVPLAVGSSHIGVLEVESTETNRFGADPLRLLQALAQPVAQAINAARLFLYQQRQEARLRMLNRLGRILTSTTDLDGLLARTVKAIHEELGYRFVALGLVEDDGDVVLKAVSSDVPVDLPIGHRQAPGEGVVGEVVRSGQPLLVRDVRERASFVPTSTQLLCEMCCPLRHGDRIFGFVDAEMDQPGALDQTDLMTLETVAEYISQALANADELHRAREFRKDLARMIVHDVRNPLNVLAASLSLLDFGQAESQNRELLLDSQQACDEILRLIDGLLGIEKIESGTWELAREITDVTALIRSLVENFQPVAAKKGIRLESSVPEAVPHVKVDPELLRRILQNLLSNALRFTPHGGGIQVSLSLATEATLHRLCTASTAIHLQVSDTGTGIPSSDLERVFDKFATVEHHHRSRHYSTGLGLTFCKRAVEAHYGTIWVDSILGQGSTFNVLLPSEP